MGSLDQLIEEQVHRWSLERRAKKRAEEPRRAAWPVITISRQFGSRGSAIGQEVAERTGFTFWDSDLLHRMSEEANASKGTPREGMHWPTIGKKAHTTLKPGHRPSSIVAWVRAKRRPMNHGRSNDRTLKACSIHVNRARTCANAVNERRPMVIR